MKNRQTGEYGPLRLFSFTPYAWGVALLWSVLLCILLAVGIVQARRQAADLARAEASAALDKDISYRSWAAMHGGVYVPVTELTRPSPYLARVPERDILTPSGRRLTLLNPSYMTRQVHEMSAASYGLRGHLTSLKPIRPENAPDVWEAAALRELERAGGEYTEETVVVGQPYFRLMRAFITDKSCLRCHGAQGYKEGDIRGGISVSIPLSPYLALARSNIRYLVLSYSLVWALGLLGLGAGVRRVRRRMDERDQARDLLRERELVFREFMEHCPFYVFFRDEETRALSLSRNYEDLLGKPLDELLGKRLDELYSPGLARRMLEDDKRVFLEGRTLVTEEALEGHVYRTIRIPVDIEGRSRRIAGYAVDITERETAEKRLAQLNERMALAVWAGGLGIWDWDVAGGRLEWDARMFELYGLKKEDFNNTYEAWLGALHPGDRARCDAETMQALRAEKRYDSEFRVVWPDGTIRHIKTSADIFRDGSGKPKRVVGVNSDVTEARLAERELKKMNQDLERKNEN